MGNNFVKSVKSEDEGTNESKKDESRLLAASENSYNSQMDNTTITPIKVLLNEQITSSAVDSIRESQLIANEMAKSLIIEFFREPSSPKKFGELLNYIFSYESVLKPSRDIVYWSLQSSETYKSVELQAKSNSLALIGPEGGASTSVTNLTSDWLLRRDTRLSTFNPVISWACKEPAVTVEPLAGIVEQVLPLTRPVLVESLKYWAGVALQSEDVK